MKATALLLACAAACSFANAQDASAWGKATLDAHGNCSMVGLAAALMHNVQVDDINKSKQCVESKIQASKDEFQAIKPQRKASADAALKDYYAAWIAAMRSLPSLLASDSRVAADSARTADRRRLNELWARFEIEAGL